MFFFRHSSRLPCAPSPRDTDVPPSPFSPLQSTERRGEHPKTAHTRGENAATATAERGDRNRSSSPQTEAEPWPPPPSQAEIGNPRRVHAPAPRWRPCPVSLAAAAAALRQWEATGKMSFQWLLYSLGCSLHGDGQMIIIYNCNILFT
jgi:hypothetical protein